MHHGIDSCGLNNSRIGREGRRQDSTGGSEGWSLEGLTPCPPSISSVAVKEQPSTTLNPLELNFNKSQIITRAHGAREKALSLD